MNIYKDWKAKLERAYSFIFKYSKITVCHVFIGDIVNTATRTNEIMKQKVREPFCAR